MVKLIHRDKLRIIHNKMLKTNFSCLRLGYMPSFNINLMSEIKFAKKHFDFIEITLKYNLKEYSGKYLGKIKQNLGNFEILGHIHWEINLTRKESLEKIYKNIEIYKFLGAKKVTIHPSASPDMNRKQIRIKNLKALKIILNLCKKNKIQLLIENTARPPFNSAKEFKFLFTKNPSLLTTLDIGHANSVSKKELDDYLNNFSTKIAHIHLHYNYGKVDHLLFPEKEKEWLNYILKRLSKLGSELTVSLEMFAVLNKQKPILIDGKQRRNLLLRQLKFIENLE